MRSQCIYLLTGSSLPCLHALRCAELAHCLSWRQMTGSGGSLAAPTEVGMNRRKPIRFQIAVRNKHATHVTWMQAWLRPFDLLISASLPVRAAQVSKENPNLRYVDKSLAWSINSTSVKLLTSSNFKTSRNVDISVEILRIIHVVYGRVIIGSSCCLYPSLASRVGNQKE